MIVTNLLTKINFSDLPETCPSTWDLTSYIPGGLLVPTHLQVRFKRVDAYWTPWGAPDGWNESTNTATFFRSGLIDEVEFRRVTPRYAPVADPLASTSRVSKTSLRINADQGMFIAQEWAAEFGIDALSTAVITDSPNELGLRQNTQNWFGPSANFKQKTWNFQFAGGYIARSHVRVVANTASGWVPLTIDTDEDPDVVSDAPFRFIGDYQLYLDLETLGPVTGLIIYRHTPRNGNVEHPNDAEVITAPRMTPSARHAFFVAVEIGEELAKVVPRCDCNLTYTSLLYPVQIDEAVRVRVPTLEGSSNFGLADELVTVPMFSLVSGELIGTISYLSYNNAEFETVQCDEPFELLGGEIEVTISFMTYDNAEFEEATAEVFGLLSGEIEVVITFQTYSNAQFEQCGPDVFQLLSGTLT